MKTHLNLSIDAGVLQSAREKALNLSQLFEDALRQILFSFETQTLPENCEHVWTWPFSTTFGLAKECRKCRTIQRVEVESYEETMKRCNMLKK